jgi:hypothetical protein
VRGLKSASPALRCLMLYTRQINLDLHKHKEEFREIIHDYYFPNTQFSVNNHQINGEVSVKKATQEVPLPFVESIV